MARRTGMMTALQAALAGFSGGLEGRAQQQAADEEKSRVAAALARQQGIDAMAMEDRQQAKKDRQQAQEDRLRSQRERLISGGYVPKGLDMPGATPRTPVSTETVDGQEYNLYSTPRQMAMQAAREEAELKAKFKPEDKLTLWQQQQSKDKAADRALRERIASSRSAKDDGDKAKQTNIGKIIAGAGKIVASSREEEKRAESQLAALDRLRPDETKFSGTDEQWAAANTAWQSKVDAAEKRLEAAQAKTSRIAPTYEGSLVSSDTTGYGAAFGPPSAPAKPPTYNTKEATLAAQAQRKNDEIQASDLTPEEKLQKSREVNRILRDEILKIRGQGR